jgi:hypothetical protein
MACAWLIVIGVFCGNKLATFGCCVGVFEHGFGVVLSQ